MGLIKEKTNRWRLFKPGVLRKIEGIRQLLQKEMAEKGTSAVIVATGDGWESHIREHYAQS